MFQKNLVAKMALIGVTGFHLAKASLHPQRIHLVFTISGVSEYGHDVFVRKFRKIIEDLSL